MKMGWNLREGNNSLWCKVLKEKYSRYRGIDGNFISKPSDSFIWKGIVQSWSNLSKFEEWSIGNGRSVQAWRDKWLEGGIVLAHCMEHIPTEIDQWKVADMVDDEGNWKTHTLSLLLPPDIIRKITALPPPMDADGADERSWLGDRMGRFTISSAYKLVCGYHELETNAIWKRIWSLEAPERIRCFIWRMRYGRIPTNKVCNRWGYGTPYCDHCVGEEETVIHALRDCPLAHNTWKNLVPIQYRLDFFTCNYQVWCNTPIFKA
jgi:hypothetical protein